MEAAGESADHLWEQPVFWQVSPPVLDQWLDEAAEGLAVAIVGGFGVEAGGEARPEMAGDGGAALILGHDAALVDTGARHDPLVGGIDEFLEFRIGHDPLGCI